MLAQRKSNKAIRVTEQPGEVAYRDGIFESAGFEDEKTIVSAALWEQAKTEKAESSRNNCQNYGPDLYHNFLMINIFYISYIFE